MHPLLSLARWRKVGDQVAPPTVGITAARSATDSRRSFGPPASVIDAGAATEPAKVQAHGTPVIGAPPAAQIQFDIRAFERALRACGWSRHEAVQDASRLARQIKRTAS